MSPLNRIHPFLSRLFSRHPKIDSQSDTPKPTSRILFINGCDLETLRRYRVSHQREQLELWGITTDEVHYTAVQKRDAERADVFIIYRCPITEQVEQFINYAHQLSKKVYFDVDDLVIDTGYTDSLPVVLAMSHDERHVFNDGVIRTGKTLKLCDGAITTTERLATELSKTTPAVFINRNVASLEMVSLSEAARKERDAPSSDVVLGYFSGSMTHNKDFELILPALANVMAQRSNVLLKVVGDIEIPSELSPYQDRIIHAEKVPWQKLPQLIASADINLAPLEPTLFNEAKSENKWMEAALVQVPTIASNFGAFSHMIEDRKTGILCASQFEWEKSLLELIDDDTLRQRIGRNAYQFSLDRCTTAETGYKLARFLFDLPTNIDQLLPQRDECRKAHVQRFLAARGISVPQTTFDPEPWHSTSLEQRIELIEDAGASGLSTALFVYERNCGDIATFRYFGYNICQRLHGSQRWRASYIFIDEIDRARKGIDKTDLVVLVRCRIRPELLDLAKQIKKRDGRLAYLIDDYALGSSTAPHIISLMATDPTSDFEQMFWRGVTERFSYASELADCLIVPNEYFAELLQTRIDMPVSVIHSSVNDEQVAISEALEKSLAPRLDDRFIIGYFSGTSSHQDDFALVEPAIIEFLTTHDDAALLLGGSFILDDDLASLHEAGKIIAMPRVDYTTLQALQASVDVVLAPLVSNDFTNCKSALKVFEAGLVETPACASPTFSYREAVQHGVNGYLCDRTSDWKRALESLYRSKSTCTRLGKAAQQSTLLKYYGEAIMREAEDTLDSVTHCASRCIPYTIEPTLRKHHDLDWDDPFAANTAFGALN